MEKVIEEIAIAANVSPEAVKAVLEQLGIDKTIEQIKENFGEQVATKIVAGDLAISARIAGLVVAR